MARIEDLSFRHRILIKSYRFRSVDWRPGARLDKPLSESKFALVSTAALHLPGQPAFDDHVRGGDSSFRELPADTDVSQLKIAHRSSVFDQTGALEDRNLVFPLDRFRELVACAKVGALNHRHFSFMGSITAPARLISETAPAVASLLRQDRVDAVFLLPVWPMCSQSVGLIASVLEKAGIPTVGLSLLRAVTEKVRPPRTLYVPFPFGYPLGKPNRPELQHQIIARALDLLKDPRPLPVLVDFEWTATSRKLKVEWGRARLTSSTEKICPACRQTGCSPCRRSAI